MRLLEAITILDVNNKWLLKSVIKVVEAKLDYMNFQEPQYGDETYRKWEEKYEYIENALDAFYKAMLLLESLGKSELNQQEIVKTTIKESISEGINYLEHCQNEYGGLSRFNVY